MAKHAYEYGKRWNVKTPRNSIKYLIDRMHVSATDQDVTEEIARRVAAARDKDPAQWTVAIMRQSIAYALICHHKNQDLYRRVMRG